MTTIPITQQAAHERLDHGGPGEDHTEGGNLMEKDEYLQI